MPTDILADDNDPISRGPEAGSMQGAGIPVHRLPRRQHRHRGMYRFRRNAKIAVHLGWRPHGLSEAFQAAKAAAARPRQETPTFPKGIGSAIGKRDAQDDAAALGRDDVERLDLLRRVDDLLVETEAKREIG